MVIHTSDINRTAILVDYPVLLFLIFVCSFVIVSLLGFLILRVSFPDLFNNHLTHESVGISGSILDVLAIFTSIPLSFILVFLWNEYNKTITVIETTVNQLRRVYQRARVYQLDTTPLDHYLTTGNVKYLDAFRETENKEIKKLIDAINDTPLSTTRRCVSQEIWYVIIVGTIATIGGTWLVKSPIWLHLYLIISVAVILSTLIFLIYYFDERLVHQQDLLLTALNTLYCELQHTDN